jgi:hypothetical protein
MTEENKLHKVAEDYLSQVIDKLNSIDQSIDYLTAALTGEDPLGIELGQRSIGRLQRPQQRNPGAAAPASVKEMSSDISPVLIEKVLESMIKEELEVILTDDEAVEMFGDQIIEESLNPEHDKASKIRSDIVRLADDLIKQRQNPDISIIASAIVKDLYGQIAWMERRFAEELEHPDPRPARRESGDII